MSAKQYRKKPVVIEAVQLTHERVATFLFDNERLPEGVQYVGSEYHRGRREVYHFKAYIETLEGKMQVSPGDWIIKGVKGEFYPCKPDIFEATYEDAAASPALLDALKAAKREIESLAQSGTQRILDLGGDCDPWEATAEATLRRAGITAALAQAEG